jgi:hypothetical protein
VSATFDAFLKAEDLDDLLKLRGQIRELTDEEEKTALVVLESWSDQQAVANLLFHPSLIPSARREHFILKALGDLDNPYFVLAAVVNAGCLAGEKTSAKTCSEIKEHLLAYCQNYNDVIGQRASVSLRSFLSKTDLLALLPLLRVRNDVIRENIIGWITQVWGGLARDKMSAEFKALGLSWFQRRSVAKSLEQFSGKRSSLIETLRTTPVLSYIPNLKEVRA